VHGPRARWLAAAVPLIALGPFATSELDRSVQDALYDFSRHRWLVDAHDALPRLLLYRLPKALLAAWTVTLAVQAWRLWRRSRPVCAPAVRERLFLVAALALVPAFVGLGKQVTGIHCPCEVDRYGGRAPYHVLLRPAPPQRPGVPRGRCFPAAHASGGFAVMALAFTGSRRLRRAGWGLALGWVMGAYQMARGAHYLSHTVVSMLLAWAIALALARAFGLERFGSDPVRILRPSRWPCS
jgi:membrane-associated PAP2 superfamily phosphatase